MFTEGFLKLAISQKLIRRAIRKAREKRRTTEPLLNMVVDPYGVKVFNAVSVPNNKVVGKAYAQQKLFEKVLRGEKLGPIKFRRKHLPFGELPKRKEK